MRPGPIPERSEDRIRRNKDGGEITKGQAMDVTWIQPANPDWHEIARNLYVSAEKSGISRYWQNSDWALFYSLCDDLSFIKNQGARRSAEMLKGVYSALQSLGLAEGDRRRMRIELEAPAPKTKLASVTAIGDAAAALEVD